MGKISKPSGQDNGLDSKVAAPASAPSIGKSPTQPITGKLKGMDAMPGGGDSKKGGPIKTVSSNPIDGKTKSSGQAMPDGIKSGFA